MLDLDDFFTSNTHSIRARGLTRDKTFRSHLRAFHFDLDTSRLFLRFLLHLTSAPRVLGLDCFFRRDVSRRREDRRHSCTFHGAQALEVQKLRDKSYIYIYIYVYICVCHMRFRSSISNGRVPAFHRQKRHLSFFY